MFKYGGCGVTYHINDPKKRTAEPDSKDRDSHIHDRSFWAGGTPEGITIKSYKFI
jgi:hypothetical protein